MSPLPVNPTRTAAAPPPQETLDQRRAKHAWKAVLSFAKDNGGKREYGEDAQEYAREVQKLPMRIMAAGLGQAVAFIMAVDFTGGTKCMSAALALQAHRWQCLFSYVGGTERTKDGVGVVVSGKEQVVHAQNPWDALGYQAAEEASTLFDQGDVPRPAAAAAAG